MFKQFTLCSEEVGVEGSREGVGVEDSSEAVGVEGSEGVGVEG